MSRPFLTCEWRNLFLANYAVPPAVLQPYLPSGLELDTRDGQAFVSLVAFEFLKARVFGVRWPGYQCFPELNLRMYVRHGAERGVVFLRELVPVRMVAWLARLIYNEPYRVAALTAERQEDDARLSMTFRLRYNGKDHLLQATGRKPAYQPGADSVEHFFKEQSWGFGVTRRGRTLRYHVEHPLWEVYPVEAFTVAIDWGAVYGPEWQLLAGAEPCSIVLAAGSAVSVYPKGDVPAG
jgi:uncharacterized protein YqjF (DUF2071 family)